MAMPRKGSRSILVGDKLYRFRISGDNGLGIANLKVAIEAIAGGNFTTLVVDTSVLTPVDLWLVINTDGHAKARTTKIVYIKTSVIRVYIRQALDTGWNPTEKGKPFVLIADPDLVFRATKDI